MKISDKLVNIQSELKAPKNQRNNFGNYNYRSCEDIVEALKPLLKKEGLFLTLSDEVVERGGRVYILATAKISDGENELHTQGFAREAETQKGMNDAQITGSASSYARKYALNGLFCIDDTKDADTNEQKTQTNNPKAQVQYEDNDKPWIDKKVLESTAFADFLKKEKGIKKDVKTVLSEVRKKYKVSKANAGVIEDLYEKS